MWPDTFQLCKQTINYKNSKIENDPHANETCLNPDSSLNLTTFQAINIKGVTKIIKPTPTSDKDFTYAVKFLHEQKNTSIKLLKFWEYFVQYKHDSHSFPEALASSLFDECNLSSKRDTGSSIDHSM